MATSGTYSFSVTAAQIINYAMLLIGKLGEGQTISTQEQSDCLFMLEMLAKQWQGKADGAPGLKLHCMRHGRLFLQDNTGKYILGPDGAGWCYAPPASLFPSHLGTVLTSTAASGAFSINVANVAYNAVNSIGVGDNAGIVLDNGNIFWTKVAGLGGYNLGISTAMPSNASKGNTAFFYPTSNQGTKPITIESAFLRDSNNEDTPLRIMKSIQEYDSLPSKTDPNNVSDPIAIYVESQGLTDAVLYTDCAGAQDVTKYICISYIESIQDFGATTNGPDYPQEWYRPLVFGLARDIAPMFDAIWTPMLEKQYLEATHIARRKDPENTALYFQPHEDGT